MEVVKVVIKLVIWCLESGKGSFSQYQTFHISLLLAF